MGNYRAPIWPIKVTEAGDLRTGNLSEVVRSDVHTVLSTRKYLGLNSGADRVMHPALYSRIPVALMMPYDPYLSVPLIQSYLIEALTFLERSGRIVILLVRANNIPAGVDARVLYRVVDESDQEIHEEAIFTSLPGGSGQI